MSNFVDIDLTRDEDELLNLVIARLADFGWTAEPADPETIWASAFSQAASELADAMGQVPSAIFRKFGTDLVGVPYQPATPAVAYVTVTTTAPVAGTPFVIPAGTQFELGTGYYFASEEDITVAVGQSTATGQKLVALEDGAGANGLSGAAQPVQQWAEIASVTVEGVTSGGIDAEDDDEYQNRLRDRFTLFAPRPITAADFAIYARSTPNVRVGRSTAIDGSDRTVNVYVAGENGLAMSSGDKSAIDAFLQASREVNFVVTVNDPTYNTIPVAYQIKCLAGYDPATVVVNVNAALTAFLSPLTWGTSYGLPSPDWSNDAIVRLNKVIGVIQATPGVDYAVPGSVKLNNVAADFTMTGTAPLPQIGTITGTYL